MGKQIDIDDSLPPALLEDLSHLAADENDPPQAAPECLRLTGVASSNRRFTTLT